MNVLFEFSKYLGPTQTFFDDRFIMEIGENHNMIFDSAKSLCESLDTQFAFPKGRLQTERIVCLKAQNGRLAAAL